MAVVTGFYQFRWKVAGEERSTVVEIAAPGLPSEQVVHIVRLEWANLHARGLSQNRLECLGFAETGKPVALSHRTKAIGPHPLFFWS